MLEIPPPPGDLVMRFPGPPPVTPGVLVGRLALFVFRLTMRSGSENRSGCSSTPFTTLNTAVLLPMPRPSVTIGSSAKPGFRRSWESII